MLLRKSIEIALMPMKLSVDQRVEEAEKRISQISERANEAVRKAKSTEQYLRRELQETEQDRDHVRSELTKLQDIIAFFPDQWEKMERKTQRARRMEQMYYVARQGENHPGVSYNCWNGSHGFDVDGDGRTMDLRRFLIEYKHECDKQSIAHDEEMYERAEQMKKQYGHQDYECER